MGINKIIEKARGMSNASISSDPLSYGVFIQERKKWIQAGGASTSDFNRWDTPGNTYFKILFHFYGEDADGSNGHKNGLLDPTWQYIGNSITTGDMDNAVKKQNYWEKDPQAAQYPEELIWWHYDTAFSYLMMNDEIERAEALYHFINLLSNINSESPWYWQKITGLDQAVARTQATSVMEWKEPAKITIECLVNPVDDRIGTLMDLYRSVVWSWQYKRCILPANLRKFDMSIVLFQQPIWGLHTPIDKPKLTDALGKVGEWITPESEDYATINPDNASQYMSSYKILEFHDCEFDYGSARTGYDNIDNVEGGQQHYKLEISYRDVYETRFNEFFDKRFGDMMFIDSYYRDISEKGMEFSDRYAAQGNPTTNFQDYDAKTEEVKDENGKTTDNKDGKKKNTKTTITPRLSTGYRVGPPGGQDPDDRVDNSINSTLSGQLTGWATNRIGTKVNKVVLGNIFKLSIPDIAQKTGSFLNGNLWAGVEAFKKVVGRNKDGSTTRTISYNIFDDKTTRPDINGSVELGNLFRANTIANT